MEETVYKVVRKVSSGKDKGYWSYLALGSSYELKYQIGQTTKPPPRTLGIMTFDSLENAEYFIKGVSSTIIIGTAILEVFGKPSLQQHPFVGNYLDISGFYTTLYALLKENNNIINITPEIFQIFATFGYTSIGVPPIGTIFMDYVTPVREVEVSYLPSP